MNSEPDNETIRKVMQELGRRGGAKSTTATKKAAKKSLEKARAKRWPKKAKKSKCRQS